jgi:23S rRNA pseudouridine1911/1915/1917 synthase
MSGMSDSEEPVPSEEQDSEAFTVGDSQPGTRLDQYLHQCYPTTSRGEIKRLLQEGCILVNGKKGKASLTPRLGDQIEIHWPAPKATEVLPEAIPLDVIFEDEDLLVLNKQAELVVHPGAGHGGGTIVNALLHHCKGQLSGIGGVERPGIVHRLDCGTSGCLVVAKNDITHRGLQAQFAAREIEKIYQCIVCGTVEPRDGEIRASIARHPSHRKSMVAVASGKTGRSAWTSYRTVERFLESTFVEAVLHTGRTHQIRVHFQYLGFPLVGDAVYGKRNIARFTEKTGFVAHRQMLHARRIAFTHPQTNTWMEFDAPLPVDFLACLSHLRSLTSS